MKAPGILSTKPQEVPACLGCDAPMSLRHLTIAIDDIWADFEPRLDKVTHTLCPNCQKKIVQHFIEDSLMNGEFPEDVRHL